MKILIKMKFGSHVYGTNVASSDTDIKGVYLPSHEDILLQRIKPSINSSTKADPNGKNGPGDVDTEFFSLQQYLKLLMEGQTVALDMLFTPKEHILELHEDVGWVWLALQQHREQFLTRGVNAFVGYARQQAAKYGLKGGRVDAVRRTLELLKSNDPHIPLHELQFQLTELVYSSDQINFVECKGPNGKTATHLEVCNRKAPLSLQVHRAIEMYQRVFDAYGARALQAEQNQGIDWKALMHAVRVNSQAKELLATGHITFPRPDRDLLLQIRKGELPYKQVAEIIEKGQEELEEGAKSSMLRDKPDYEYADQIVIGVYSKEILDGYDY